MDAIPTPTPVLPALELRWESDEQHARRLYVGGQPDPVADGHYKAGWHYTLRLPGAPLVVRDGMSRLEVEAFVEGVVTAWFALAKL